MTEFDHIFGIFIIVACIGVSLFSFLKINLSSDDNIFAIASSFALSSSVYLAGVCATESWFWI